METARIRRELARLGQLKGVSPAVSSGKRSRVPSQHTPGTTPSTKTPEPKHVKQLQPTPSGKKTLEFDASAGEESGSSTPSTSGGLARVPTTSSLASGDEVEIPVKQQDEWLHDRQPTHESLAVCDKAEGGDVMWPELDAAGIPFSTPLDDIPATQPFLEWEDDEPMLDVQEKEAALQHVLQRPSTAEFESKLAEASAEAAPTPLEGTVQHLLLKPGTVDFAEMECAAGTVPPVQAAHVQSAAAQPLQAVQSTAQSPQAVQSTAQPPQAVQSTAQPPEAAQSPEQAVQPAAQPKQGVQSAAQPVQGVQSTAQSQPMQAVQSSAQFQQGVQSAAQHVMQGVQSTAQSGHAVQSAEGVQSAAQPMQALQSTAQPIPMQAVQSAAQPMQAVQSTVQGVQSAAQPLQGVQSTAQGVQSAAQPMQVLQSTAKSIPVQSAAQPVQAVQSTVQGVQSAAQPMQGVQSTTQVLSEPTLMHRVQSSPQLQTAPAVQSLMPPPPVPVKVESQGAAQPPLTPAVTRDLPRASSETDLEWSNWLNDAGQQDAEAKAKEEKRQVKNAYMRMTRSFGNTRCPAVIVQKYNAAKGDRRKMHELFEEFISSKEDWARSTIVTSLVTATSTQRRGRYEWKRKQDIMAMYDNDEAIVNELIRIKESQGLTRKHPEFPNNEAMKLYKVWVAFREDDVDTETRTTEIRCEGEVDNTEVAFEVPSASTAGADAAAGHLPPPPKPKEKTKVKKEKSAVQQAKQANTTANDLLLEISGYDHRLKVQKVSEGLRHAFVNDMKLHGAKITRSKEKLEAALTTGTTNDDLLVLVKEMDVIIKHYRDASKHIRSLCVEPAAKKQPKGKAATSCAELQRAAAAMVAEAGEDHVSEWTRKMSRIGCSGKYPGNCERDLFRALQLPIALYYVDIPILDPSDRKTTRNMQLPVILPHLTVEYLLHTRKVVVCQADVEEYWRHLQGAKVQWALDHPGAFSCVPLGIYGDEGQISKSGDKVMVITFNFVLDNRAGDGVIHRFPIATLREWCSLGMRSMHPLSQVMAWSFNALYTGKHPSVDFSGQDTLPAWMKAKAGQDLPGRFCVTESRGDWKWQKQWYSLKYFWVTLISATAVMHRSRATRTGAQT
ncbi:unnamed protein product [Symbiodinium sp. CCMP2592]|nr:unnamed protein product [Symbiodinium sp. CCMP2592]